MVNGDSSFGDMKDQERRSSEGENRVVFCVIEVPITFYREMLSWQLNIQAWIQEKGQA